MLWCKNGACCCEIGAVCWVVTGMVKCSTHQLQPVQMKRYAGLKRSRVLSVGEQRPGARQDNRFPYGSIMDTPFADDKRCYLRDGNWLGAAHAVTQRAPGEGTHCGGGASRNSRRKAGPRWQA